MCYCGFPLPFAIASAQHKGGNKKKAIKGKARQESGFVFCFSTMAKLCSLWNHVFDGQVTHRRDEYSWHTGDYVLEQYGSAEWSSFSALRQSQLTTRVLL